MACIMIVMGIMVGVCHDCHSFHYVSSWSFLAWYVSVMAVRPVRLCVMIVMVCVIDDCPANHVHVMTHGGSVRCWVGAGQHQSRPDSSDTATGRVSRTVLYCRKPGEWSGSCLLSPVLFVFIVHYHHRHHHYCCHHHHHLLLLLLFILLHLLDFFVLLPLLLLAVFSLMFLIYNENMQTLGTNQFIDILA